MSEDEVTILSSSPNHGHKHVLPTNAEIRPRKNLVNVNFKRRLSIKGISKREITFAQRVVMAHYLQLLSKVLPYEDASGQLQWNPGNSNSEGKQKTVRVKGEGLPVVLGNKGT